MRHRLIFLVAVLLALPLFAAAPRFGREVPASPYEYGDPGLAIYNADIATNGDGYLAAWTDTRLGNSVWVARMAADGTLLDKTGIRVGDGYFAEVIWTGESYVVAWRFTDGVHIAKVSRDGVVSGARHIIEGLGGPDIALASTGRTIAVAMSGGPVVLLDLSLAVRARGEIGLAGSPQNTLAIAASDDQYLFAYVTEAELVITQTFEENGALGAPERIDESDGANMVSVASDGTSYLVVWTTHASDLRGQLVTTANEVTGAARTFASSGPVTGANSRVVQSPHVMWSGGEYLATFFTGGSFTLPQEASALLISSAGETVGEPQRFGVANGLDHANIAAKNNGSGAVIWTDEQFRVRVGLYDATTIASRDPFVKIVSAANAAHVQSGPSIVAVERTPVVAWIERSTGVEQVRIARAGGAPLVVSDGAASRVFLTYDGETLAVVWTYDHASEIFVRRYTRTLEPLDAHPMKFIPSIRTRLESVASANGVIALTSSRELQDLYFTRLEPSGDGLSGQMIRITFDNDPNAEDTSSVVVWDGSRFAVAWLRHHFLSVPGAAEVPDVIFGTHVTFDGRLMPPGQIYQMLGGGIATLSASARNGKVVLAWQEVLVESWPGDVTGTATYVAPFDGSSLERRLVVEDDATFSHHLTDLELHADGRADLFWVNWVDGREETTLRVIRLSPELAPEGEPFVSEPFAGPRPNRWWDPQEKADFDATIAGDDAVMAYVRRDDSPQAGNVGRIVLRGEQGPSTKRRAVR
jgi:hypothetical protein